MWIGIDALFGLFNADQRQHFDHVLFGLCFTNFTVFDNGFCQLFADLHIGIKGSHRLLKDKGNSIAAYIAQKFIVFIQQIVLVKGNHRLPAVFGHVVRQQFNQRHRRHRFAGARLTDYGQSLLV